MDANYETMTLGAIRERLIEKAVEDETFRARLLADPKETVQDELGLKAPGRIHPHGARGDRGHRPIWCCRLPRSSMRPRWRRRQVVMVQVVMTSGITPAVGESRLGRGAAGPRLRVPGRRPPGALPEGVPDRRRGGREGGGPGPAGAGGVARPGGRGGGRAGLDGRPRLPWLRQSGRDGARPGPSSAWSCTARSSGSRPTAGDGAPSSPGSRSAGGAFPRRPRGCGAGRGSNG